MSNLKTIRKLIMYYVASAGTTWGIISTTKLDVTFAQLVIFMSTLFFLVIVYVVVEEEDISRNIAVNHERDIKEGSFILDLVEGLEKVRYADVYDEEIAEEANKIVRRDLDKFAVTYKSYKKWRHKNKLVFSAVVDESNKLIGFFDIWPLTEDAAKRILSGLAKERRLTEDDILEYNNTMSANNIYIASIMVNNKQKRFSNNIAREIIVIKLYEYIGDKFAPLEEKRFIAYAHTKYGEVLLERAGFRMRLRKKDNVQNRPLYVLEPGQSETPLARYNRIRNGFIVIGSRRSV